MQMIEFNFYLALCFFGPPSRALVDYYLEKGGMPLRNAVGVNCKKGVTTKNQGAGA